MKTFKIVFAALTMLVSASSFATDSGKKEKLNMSFAVQTYIDAMSHGKIKGMHEVLDTDAKFTITGGNKTLNYNKTQILYSLKQIENIQQNCVTSYNIVDLNATQAIVKVTMKYERFSRVNFLSMANTAEGWKITNVSSSFLRN